MAGFLDSLTEGLTSGDFLGSALLSTVGLVSGLSQQQAYGNTEDAFNQSLALQYAQLDQQAKNSAAEIAAQLEAAGISADAAIEAANIQVEGMLKKAKIDAATQTMALKEKALADSIAQRITAKRGNPELLTKAQEDTNASRIATGQVAQQGYGNAANVLAAFRR